MRIVGLALACLQVACGVDAGATEVPRGPVSEVVRPHATEAVHAHSADPLHGRVCFNAAETRDKVAAHALSEPFRLLRGAAGRLQGEALRAKLCRFNDDYVYDIALLRRDGRVIHVFLNALSGKSVGAYNDR